MHSQEWISICYKQILTQSHLLEIWHRIMPINVATQFSVLASFLFKLNICYLVLSDETEEPTGNFEYSDDEMDSRNASNR